jgi:hypothetical protein
VDKVGGKNDFGGIEERRRSASPNSNFEEEEATT